MTAVIPELQLTLTGLWNAAAATNEYLVDGV
jgi:hypothetical protein